MRKERSLSSIIIQFGSCRFRDFLLNHRKRVNNDDFLVDDKDIGKIGKIESIEYKTDIKMYIVKLHNFNYLVDLDSLRPVDYINNLPADQRQNIADILDI